MAKWPNHFDSGKQFQKRQNWAGLALCLSSRMCRHKFIVRLCYNDFCSNKITDVMKVQKKLLSTLK